jgi:hypothetical protein
MKRFLFNNKEFTSLKEVKDFILNQKLKEGNLSILDQKLKKEINLNLSFNIKQTNFTYVKYKNFVMMIEALILTEVTSSTLFIKAEPNYSIKYFITPEDAITYLKSTELKNGSVYKAYIWNNKTFQKLYEFEVSFNLT